MQSIMGCPSVAPGPVMTCTVSGGSPASSSSPAAHNVEKGVRESGLMRTALPASRAGIASVMPSVSG